jgi:dual specificity MAP kinase phosphatase
MSNKSGEIPSSTLEHVKNRESQQYYNVQESLLQKNAYSEFQMVIPGLYLGSQISSLNTFKLEEHNIKLVLRVNGIAQNMIAYEKHGIDFKMMDIDDMPDFDIEPLFEESNALIHSYLTAGKNVLVVCTAGISRSAAIVIAYLIKHHRKTY